MPRLRRAGRLAFLAFQSVLLTFGSNRAVCAEPSATLRERRLVVGGIVADARIEDVLGLSHNRFQGLIAAELSSAGYRLSESAAPGDAKALTLWGTVKEEVCDGRPPGQCRVEIQWELQDWRGVVAYRTATRAVAAGKEFEPERRELVLGALTSLMRRRRFGLQLEGFKANEPQGGPLGFKRCHRPELRLPEGVRAAAAAVVLVASGSNLARGVIVSPDGFILTSSQAFGEGEPLTVRFSAGQRLTAQVVALDPTTHVALLRTDAHTASACLALSSDRVNVGDSVFGVSSELNDDAVTSLSRSVVLDAQASGLARLQVDARIAQGIGAPLISEQGTLLGLVAGSTAEQTPGRTSVLSVTNVLDALRIKPAEITDQRLMGIGLGADGGYVRDPDDPPFVLGKRYTYGSSSGARALRVASLTTAGVGAAGIVYTWLTYRSASSPSPAEHNRFVIENDVSWVLFGLGAAGLGASFVWPEPHSVVAVGTEAASRRRLSIALSGAGLMVTGAM